MQKESSLSWLIVCLILGTCGVVFGVGYAMQPSSLESSSSTFGSGLSREERAVKLGAEISRSVPRRGFISGVYAELEQCRLTIRVEYDRPCNDALAGQSLIADKTTVDLRELSGAVSDVRLSSYSSEDTLRYHWNFESNVKKQIIDLNGDFLRELGRLMDNGVKGDERAERLSRFTKQLLARYGIESHIANQLCLKKPIPEPLPGGVFYLELDSSGGKGLMSEILSYKNMYCQN